jgi:sec-independent protein translocase protein TatB
MLRAMFGMGGSEILVILIVALLFLGPDKLPEAAKQISKGIRDIKKQSRVLQQTIEDDEHIGGAIRDLKSALRGEEIAVRPKPKPPKQIEAAPTPDPVPAIGTAAAALAGISVVSEAGAPTVETDPAAADASAGPSQAATEANPTPAAEANPTPATEAAAHAGSNGAVDTAFEGAAEAHTATPDGAGDAPKLTLPPTAGEPGDAEGSSAHDAADLASLVKPAPNTVARGSVPAAPAAGPPEPSEPKHG